MSILKSCLAAASIAAFAVPAFADPAPDGPAQHGWHQPSPEQMAAWHTQMCKDHYAHKAGQLAYLEASLSITGAQRGAFDQWRDAVLSSAKAHSDACLAHAPMQHGTHDALERSGRMEKMLESKLADLRSERPALEALYASLSPEQKQIFDRSEHGFGHHHHMDHMMGHMGEHIGDGHDGHGPQSPG